jgi:RNA polymerase sigma-70 factor, ECF subfamily
MMRDSYAMLCSQAHRFVKDRHVAEGLVHDVLLKVWENRSSWQPQGSPQAYLLSAVRNRCLNHLRDQHLHREKEHEIAREYAPVALPDEHVRYREVLDAVAHALTEIPERRRLIYLLHRVHGFTYAEIAASLGISENTVDTQIRRSLQHLRERLVRFL